MVRINLNSGEVLSFKPSPSRKFRGLKIPGSSLYKAESCRYHFLLHLFTHRLYTLTLRQFLFVDPGSIIISELNNWLRLELPLSGQLSVVEKGGGGFQLSSGAYQLTDQSVFGLKLQAHPSPTVYFTAHFSPELLASLGTDPLVSPQRPRPVPQDLLETVYDILRCPFVESLRDFYYANKVRELLFAHLVSVPVVLPGELSPGQIAQMYEADRIMASNLDGKITIPELARQLGTNFVTLKRNYEKVFGIGIFPRLMQRKMAHIQLLLEKTNKPLKEIADLAGYQTLPGFINAFRKRFKVTPKEWRDERRGIKGRA
jgi:AraC-like DNA-binding protein